MLKNKRLELKTWVNILRNLEEINEEVEVLWLDGTDEYVLAYNCELFEDGFQDEYEAYNRLENIITEITLMR